MINATQSQSPESVSVIILEEGETQWHTNALYYTFRRTVLKFMHKFKSPEWMYVNDIVI